MKKYYKKNSQRPEVISRRKLYRQRPDVKERVKKYLSNPKVKERYKENFKNRYKKDINYRIKCILRARLGLAIKNSKTIKSSTTMSLIGCSINNLLIHLEKQFDERMTRENMGARGWHIHHIDECQDFDLTRDEDQKKCFHYTNLQPIWWTDHPKITMENRKVRKCRQEKT